MYPGTRFQGKSPRAAKPILTAGLRWAPETAPMNRMTAITMRPGATTAATRPTAPGSPRLPLRPCGDDDEENVPKTSPNNLRHSSRGLFEVFLVGLEPPNLRCLADECLGSTGGPGHSRRYPAGGLRIRDGECALAVVLAWCEETRRNNIRDSERGTFWHDASVQLVDRHNYRWRSPLRHFRRIDRVSMLWPALSGFKKLHHSDACRSSP